MEEYRKCSDSGTVYDDPRVAVGSSVLTKLERKRKRSQNTRPSDTASSHCGSPVVCERSDVRDRVDAGRTRAAEGINRQVIFRC